MKLNYYVYQIQPFRKPDEPFSGAEVKRVLAIEEYNAFKLLREEFPDFEIKLLFSAAIDFVEDSVDVEYTKTGGPK